MKIIIFLGSKIQTFYGEFFYIRTTKGDLYKLSDQVANSAYEISALFDAKNEQMFNFKKASCLYHGSQLSIIAYNNEI